MKKSISILLCCILIFSASVTSFAAAADWSTTDQSNLSNASSKLTSIYNLLNSGGAIYNLLNTISNNVNTIKSYLYDGNHSIAYWVSAINSWMQPIYTSLSSNLAANLNLEFVVGGLNKVVFQDGYTSYYPYLEYNGKSNANWLSDINSVLRLESYPYYNQVNPTAPLHFFRYRNGLLDSTFTPQSTPLSGLFYYVGATSESVARHAYDHLNGFNSTQNVINWGNLGTSTFTPISATDGLYKYLSSIQAPVARLSYVLASDERIEAQQASAANEQAVVDNFIDSTGDGSVPTSSFSDVSGLSSGVSSNLSTDASPAQIWDIFNSDHGSWFSQETANQLDTTTRMRGSEFETPLLDQQMEEIYKSLGGGK